MKREALNQIQHLINISELMDQKGFQKESIKSIYDAFVIAEAESYRIASEINNMTKTASRSVGESKIKELENSFVVTSSIGSSISNWLKTRGSDWLKNLGKRIGTKGGEEIKEDATGLLKARRNLGKLMGGAAGDIETGAGFLRNKNKIQNQLSKVDEALALAETLPPHEAERLEKTRRLLLQQLDKLEKGQRLTDLGKLTAGTAAVGAAGIGGASALRGGKKRPVEEEIFGERPLGEIYTGSRGLRQEAPFVGGAGMKGFGPATIPSGANVMMAPPNIMDIQQRIDNLERVVEAIRAKVGV